MSTLLCHLFVLNLERPLQSKSVHVVAACQKGHGCIHHSQVCISGYVSVSKNNDEEAVDGEADENTQVTCPRCSAKEQNLGLLHQIDESDEGIR